MFLGDDRHCKGDRDELIAAAQVIEQILDRVLPKWRQTVPADKSVRWQQQHREAAQRAIVQLERKAEVREKLGDNSPQLDAARMHPWAWERRRLGEDQRRDAERLR